MISSVSFMRSVVWLTTATRSRSRATSNPGVRWPAKTYVEPGAHHSDRRGDDRRRARRASSRLRTITACA